MKVISRRTMLGSGGVVACAIGVLAFPPVRNSLCAMPLDDPALAWSRGAIGIGRRCVAEYPSLTRAHAAQRLAEYEGALNTEGCTPEVNDFAQGRTRTVDGWILAESEITVYVATYYGLISSTSG